MPRSTFLWRLQSRGTLRDSIPFDVCVARFFSARCSLFGETRAKLTRPYSPRQMEDYAAIQLKEYRKTAKLMGVFRKPAAPGETKANANQEGKDVSDKDMAQLMASGMKRPRGS